MSIQRSAYRLLSDAPYTREGDPLGFDEVAQSLEKLIVDSRGSTPIAIGIQGGWGTGKSSLMEKLRKRLDSQDTVVAKTVTFNAWLYEGRDITEGFIKTVLNSFDDENLIRRTFRRKKAMALLRVVIGIAAGYLGIGKAVDQAWRAFTQDTEITNQFQDLFRQLVNTWAKRRKLKGRGELLVVFIDDLDRCGSDSVLQLMEAIKLYLGVENMVFVIGYDRSPIAACIQEKIGRSQLVTGDQYMEKIIQVPFSIPAPNEGQLDGYIEMCLAESRAKQQFEGLEDVIVGGNEGNPRKIKLFINSFVIRDSTCRPDERMDPAYLSRILLLDLYFHQFYRLYVLRDPRRIGMLVDYIDLLDAVRKTNSFDDLSPEVQNMLENNRRDGISFDADDGSEELVRKVLGVFPADFERYAEDRELVRLIRSLVDALAKEEEKEEVFERVSKYADSQDYAEQQILRETLAEKVSQKEARILWVDDFPENNDWIREKMIPSSVINVIATTTEEAMKELEHGDFSLVISDIARGDDHEAGFKLAEDIREKLRNPVTPIFYTGRVTQNRRSRAKEMSVRITSDPYELVDMIRSHLSSPS